MAINVDLSETDPSNVGFVPVGPGQAHVLVTDAVEYGGKSQEHVVKVTVLAHTDPHQVGKTHQEYFPTAANMVWKLLGFAYATKIANKEAMTAAKAAGQRMAPIELSHAIGRQFFCTFSQSEKNGKTFVNLDKLLEIDSPDAVRHPRDAAALAKAMGGTVTATAPVAPVQMTPAPGAGQNPFGALAGTRPA